MKKSFEDFTKLKDFMGHLTNWRMPGNSIVVYKDDEPIFSHSTGYAERLKTFNWPHLCGYGYGLGVRTIVDKSEAGFTGGRNEFGWGGAAGATVLVDTENRLSYFYAHHMLNPQESYYQPRLRNVVYSCLD